MKAIGYDSETTGLPEWKIPSDDPIQPHIVQLGWISTATNMEHVRIIKPDGWVIPPEMTAIHGITHEFASDCGRPEIEVVEEFLEDWRKHDVRVGHNEQFDARIIRIALKRFRPALLEEWRAGLAFCTMIQTKKFFAGSLAGKKPERNTLACIYEHLTGKELDNAHNALRDAQASMTIYNKLMEMGR